MFKKNHQVEEQLDQLGRLVLRAASQNDQESEAAAGSPFLFTRVRARIDEELRQNESGGWLKLPFVARRAVPAMALIALLAAGVTFWPSASNTPPIWQRLDDEALFDTRDPGVEQAVLSRNNLSQEDVFNLVLERDEREKR